METGYVFFLFLLCVSSWHLWCATLPLVACASGTPIFGFAVHFQASMVTWKTPLDVDVPASDYVLQVRSMNFSNIISTGTTASFSITGEHAIVDDV